MVENEEIQKGKEWRKGDNPEITLDEIRKMLATWNSLAWTWELILLILGIAAITSSLFISAFCAVTNLWLKMTP